MAALLLTAALGLVGGGRGGRSLLVLGGSGFVGREVCRNAVQRGYSVTSLSRRGLNPDPESPLMSQVDWQAGDATDPAVIGRLASRADAAVHAIGLLFDTESGLGNLNVIVSGSGSVPGATSTYDRITRLTAFNLIKALKSRPRLPGSRRTPLCFVSAAEAGWPEVALGDRVEELAPGWLKSYLGAKRAVEAELRANAGALRPVIYRPSLIWNWKKLDVLPVIPVFNLLAALGVPFVDKTVRVETLGKAIVAALDDELVEGVQRCPQMEQLAAR
jgi:nucleoside-diphosphate-sugar epimerase